MVSAKHHKQSANSRWKQQETLLGNDIRKEKSSAIANANLVECLFIISVQWGEINIRGCLVNIHVPVRRAENAF